MGVNARFDVSVKRTVRAQKKSVAEMVTGRTGASVHETVMLGAKSRYWNGTATQRSTASRFAPSAPPDWGYGVTKTKVEIITSPTCNGSVSRYYRPDFERDLIPVIGGRATPWPSLLYAGPPAVDFQQQHGRQT